MNFTIARKEFLSALNIGASLAGKSKAIPVLDNVKIKVKNGALTVVSMDGQSAISKKVDTPAVGDDGDFAVNASDLLKAIKALRDDLVAFDYTSENNTLTITHEKGKLTLSATGVEEFPSINKGENSVSFEMSCEPLFDWLNTAKSFVSNDNIRPVMCGMYIEVKDNAIAVCASDGHKLFTDSIVTNDDVATNTIIPSSVFSAIQSVINGFENCTVTIDDTHTTITVDGARICVRKFDGRYPNFRTVIPQKNPLNVEVNKADFNDSINRASICANSASVIRMSINGGNMSLEADNVDFGKSAKEDLLCVTNNANIVIGFNCDSMLASLSNITSENVTLLLESEYRAMLIKDNDAPNKIFLCMPCLLN